MNLKTEAREKWALMIGPKSNQFDQNAALDQIIDHVLSEVKKGVPRNAFSGAGAAVVETNEQSARMLGFNDCRTQILTHLASLKGNNSRSSKGSAGQDSKLLTP